MQLRKYILRLIAWSIFLLGILEGYLRSGESISGEYITPFLTCLAFSVLLVALSTSKPKPIYWGLQSFVWLLGVAISYSKIMAYEGILPATFDNLQNFLAWFSLPLAISGILLLLYVPFMNRFDRKGERSGGVKEATSDSQHFNQMYYHGYQPQHQTLEQSQIPARPDQETLTPPQTDLFIKPMKSVRD